MGISFAVRRDRRAGTWAGAVLVVLLAALLHVLCCAHGPASAGSGRADTVAAVSYAADHDHAACAPAHEGGEECRGADEPSVQAPRGIQVDPDALQFTVPRAEVDGAAALRYGPPPDGTRGPLPALNERSRLGVWRT
ncbi:hypothetical protein ACFV9W_06505 [Streptomyces sp. NPDC059897]|uniref:hypothetical protein n=1 Tax=Streptomyces sp. NPDC059897 TaxID=3346994 RepID=UPI00365CB516